MTWVVDERWTIELSEHSILYGMSIDWIWFRNDKAFDVIHNYHICLLPMTAIYLVEIEFRKAHQTSSTHWTRSMIFPEFK